MARDIFIDTVLIRDAEGDSIPARDILVEVFQAGTVTPVNIFQSRIGGTTGPSPDAGAGATGQGAFTTGASGLIIFWAEKGEYDIRLTDTITPARIAQRTIGFNALTSTDLTDTSTSLNTSISSVQTKVDSVQTQLNNQLNGLKIIRGIVNADGSIGAGTGFTITKGGTGAYTINYTTPFSGLPSISGNTRLGGLGKSYVTFSFGLASSAGVEVRDAGDASNHANRDFSFIAVGPA